MPLAALAIDISWECYFTFFTGAPWSQRIPAMPWFVLNLGVLYTAYRYGREDFDWPILKRWFRTILTLMLLVAFWLVYSFIKAFDDSYGALTSMFAVIGYSTLLPVMLIRRNSIKGQSIYIALLILLGDAAGYIPPCMPRPICTRRCRPGSCMPFIAMRCLSTYFMSGWSGGWRAAMASIRGRDYKPGYCASGFLPGQGEIHGLIEIVPVFTPALVNDHFSLCRREKPEPVPAGK